MRISLPVPALGVLITCAGILLRAGIARLKIVFRGLFPLCEVLVVSLLDRGEKSIIRHAGQFHGLEK